MTEDKIGTKDILIVETIVVIIMNIAMKQITKNLILILIVIDISLSLFSQDNFPFVISKHGNEWYEAPQNLFGQSYDKRSDLLKEHYTSTSPSWDSTTEYLTTKFDSEDSSLFEGFLIDILNRLATDLNFNYVIRSNSKLYGSLDSRTGNWSGIIGQLVSRVQSYAICKIS